MVDYMQKAREALVDAFGDAGSHAVRVHATTLEALDKAEAERDAPVKIIRWALTQPASNLDGIMASLCAAIPVQPEPDPLVLPTHLEGVEPWPGGQASEVLADFRAAFQQEADWWKPDPEDPYWMLEKADGSWLKNTHSCLTTRDATKAIRYPSEWHADNARRGLHGTNNILFKPTEHKWCASLARHGLAVKEVG